MNKLLITFGVLALTMGVNLTFMTSQAHSLIFNEVEKNIEHIEIVESNVGDGLEYAYWITRINGNEVHGKPLNRISNTNKGIFLYKEEIGQNVRVGDKVVVVWGEEEDEFTSIKVFDREKTSDYVLESIDK